MLKNGRYYKEKTCKVSVDTTDCHIQEPKQSEYIRAKLRAKGDLHNPYDPRFKSHKIGKAALRYELAICIRTGDIVWVNGPFPAGAWNDIAIFKGGIMKMLDEGEKCEVDNGYIGLGKYARNKHVFVSRVDRKAKSKALARHECVNRLIKKFNCTKNMFRHPKEKHGICVGACVALIQIGFDSGEKPWQVSY